MKIVNFFSKLLMDKETERRVQAEGIEPIGFQGLRKVFSEHFSHLTLYNPLGVLAGAAFLASTLNPWWHATALGGGRHLNAFAFVLKHNVPPEGWRFLIETPPLASVALACGLLGYFSIVLWGGTMAGKKGKLFVASSGLLMLTYTAGFFGTVYFACYRIGGTPLEEFILIANIPVTVDPRFLPSYYYAIGAGFVCLLSSLIHGMVTIRLYRKKNSDLVGTK